MKRAKQPLKNIRGKIMLALMLGAFAVFAGVLIHMQIFNHAYYISAESAISTKQAAVPAARGDILDRNGVPLLTSREANTVIFEASYFPPLSAQDERNRIIISLVNLLESEGEVWIDRLPIELNSKGGAVFAENRKTDIDYLRSAEMLDLNPYADAGLCMEALIERYGLQEYKLADARKIASVCYAMRRMVFSASSPYTFAEDISGDTAARIKENSSFYRGVEIGVVSYREYTDGTLAPHILGMVGAISQEEYQANKDNGYDLNDTIGKNGIEKAMESFLRGQNGTKSFYTDAEGNITEEMTQEPVKGGNVVLTIDAGLQKVAQDALRKTLLSNAVSPVTPAGAAVVIDCSTGEILACASYPTYDISQYSENFKEIESTPGSPLVNRGLNGTYEAGSTMKPSVAIAGLEEGVIEADTRIRCTGSYPYKDMNFKCDQYHISPMVSVVAAIRESCNIFFYDTGVNLGISKINEYRTLLGLGQKTGTELAESAGVLDSPEYRDAIGQTWLPGYTLQSAIGQAGNLFTPVQLANYCATIANGGTRYRPHFVKTVKSCDFASTLLENKGEVVIETGFSPMSLALVKEGMHQVATIGYCRTAFAGLPVEAAAKTGTSQVIRTINGSPQKTHNGLLIGYAPYDKPQIAVCVVCEGFDSGTATSPVAAAIFEYWFSDRSDVSGPQNEGVLLG